MPLVNKGNDVNWSSLPVLILWKIKDKLDIFDDMCLAFVCRDWRYASLNYPKKQLVGDGMPWIMQESENELGSSWDFISITRKKKFTLDLPESRNCQVLFSKEGWILMRRKNFCDSQERLADSIFLLNPLTKSKIELPDVTERHEYYGCFSTHAGVPKHVVLLGAGKSRQTMLRTAYPGGSVWNEHLDCPMIYEGCRCLISTGQQIYFINIWGKMIIYNMSNRIWQELPGPRNEMGVNYILEHERNIVKLSSSGYDDEASFSLFTHSDNDTEWKRLSNDEMNITLYLSKLHNCFCARDKGLKVYALHPNYGGLLRSRIICGYDVFSYDLLDGYTQILQLPYGISSSAKWVDIG